MIILSGIERRQKLLIGMAKCTQRLNGNQTREWNMPDSLVGYAAPLRCSCQSNNVFLQRLSNNSPLSPQIASQYGLLYIFAKRAALCGLELVSPKRRLTHG